MYIGKNNIVIPLKGLSQGKHCYEFDADGEFFASFGNTQIKDAQCVIAVEVERNGSFMGVRCEVKGSIVAECDRCLEDVVLPVDIDRSLSVKCSKVQEESDDDDVMIVDETSADIDLNQFVYDYVCLDIPIQVLHPEGECNPDMVRRIGIGSGEESNSENTPFSGLKDLLNSKNN